MQKGFSIIDALISMVILAVGSVAFVKATSNHVVVSTTFVEQQQVSQMASTLNNLVSAHVQTLPVGSSRGNLIAHINRFTRAFDDEMEVVQRSRRYTCDESGPVLDSSGGARPQVSATLFKVWSEGPPVCVEFRILPAVPTDQYSVWMETIIRRAAVDGGAGEVTRLPILVSVVP